MSWRTLILFLLLLLIAGVAFQLRSSRTGASPGQHPAPARRRLKQRQVRPVLADRAHRALVVGAQGVIGRNLIEHLVACGDWDIIGLSRRGGKSAGRVRHIAVDLLDANDSSEKLRALTTVTHIFYAAYQDRPTWAELVPPNLAMLVNVVNAVVMADKEPLWNAMVQKHDLAPHGYQQVSSWQVFVLVKPLESAGIGDYLQLMPRNQPNSPLQ